MYANKLAHGRQAPLIAAPDAALAVDDPLAAAAAGPAELPVPEGSLLLVLPTVAEMADGELHLDGDFANNVTAYLRAFQTVTVMCPLRARGNDFPRLHKVVDIPGSERLRIILLPEAYREDRYLRHRLRIGRLLREEIGRATHRLISPHATFCWSTLAAELCIKLGKRYNMEGDWHLQQVARYNWSLMPFGPNKLRKYLWQLYHTPKYMRCLRHSSLALVKAGDVYEAYKSIAPNAFPVMNVQVTPEDQINAAELEEKLRRAERGEPLRFVYSGRAIDMKGPMQWMRVLRALRQRGIPFTATWFGEGDRLDKMRAFRDRNGLADCCELPGKVTRDRLFEATKQADVFLFCHMTSESPRCVQEALACGAPTVGFDSSWARLLVEREGGGAFVDIGDEAGLTDLVAGLHHDRAALRNLIWQASNSGRRLDRENAIGERIALMRQYLDS